MQGDEAGWVPRTDDPDAVYDAVSTWVEQQGLSLYPHQDEAIIELLGGSNVVLATPTGSGKSLVAIAAHAAALAAGRVSFYTAPIKALVSEKFFAYCEIFGPANVGMLTGDASVNSEAPIICCTAEVLANIALREGPDADVGLVVMDEFHFYAEPDRGWAWQVPLLELSRAQFVLMSATLGDVTVLAADLTRRNGRPDGGRRRGRAPGAAGLLLGDDPSRRHPRGADRGPAGPGVRRALHAGGRRRARHLAARGQTRCPADPRGARRDQRATGRLPLRSGLRQDPAQAGAPRHRRPPRRDAAALPPSGGAAGPGRTAGRHLRDGHPRGGHQRADPDGAVHRAREVRRHQTTHPPLARVHADRGPRRPGRLRHHGLRRRPGTRARHRQRDRPEEDRRRPQEAARLPPQEGARRRSRLVGGDLRQAGVGHPRTARLPHEGRQRDADQRRRPQRRRLPDPAAAAHRQPREPTQPAEAGATGAPVGPQPGALRRAHPARRARRASDGATC